MKFPITIIIAKMNPPFLQIHIITWNPPQINAFVTTFQRGAAKNACLQGRYLEGQGGYLAP